MKKRCVGVGFLIVAAISVIAYAANGVCVEGYSTFICVSESKVRMLNGTVKVTHFDTVIFYDDSIASGEGDHCLREDPDALKSYNIMTTTIQYPDGTHGQTESGWDAWTDRGSRIRTHLWQKGLYD